MKIGIIREGKNPPDKRVPLSPEQCAEVMRTWNVDLAVQPSPVRKFTDAAYEAAGIKLQEDLSDCDILMGVKEVPVDQLIPNKTYFFFSHTIKMQPYNAKLLKAVLDKKIRLIDYEVLKNKEGHRLIGFGRYAGIVGCYNAFRAYGLKNELYELKPAHLCHDREEMESELHKVTLPSDFRCVLTGMGRVGHGAREIIDLLPIKEVTKSGYLLHTHDQPVFTHLDAHDYNERISDHGFDKAEFFEDPHGYQSCFLPFLLKSDMYIACHFWAEGAPYLFTREDAKHPAWRTSVVADVSCDIDGPVASTLRASTIEDPLYGYDRMHEVECDWKDPQAICVMAVDNLPCELPKDASEDFGAELIHSIFPALFGSDPDKIIERASETDLDGNLTPGFAYLKDYANKALTA